MQQNQINPNLGIKRKRQTCWIVWGVFLYCFSLGFDGREGFGFWGGVFLVLFFWVVVFVCFFFLSDVQYVYRFDTHFLRCSQPVLIQSRSNLGLGRIELQFFFYEGLYTRHVNTVESRAIVYLYAQILYIAVT